MTLDELREHLDAGPIRPVYLVVGEEALLRDDAVSEIRTAVLSEGASDFDFDRLEGSETTPAVLLDAVGMLPVLAQRRLVVLREPEPQRGKGKGLPDALLEAVELLAGFDDCVLVVVAEKVDGRARWVKKLGADGVVRCDPPRGNRAVETFIRAEAKRQGIAFDPAAVALLAERTGPQLLMLRQEIAKAGLFVGAEAKVSAEHVEISTCDVAEEPVWDLTDAIGEGRLGDAVALLARMLRGGGAPPAILGALVNHFRKLVRARNGDSVPGPPFAVRKLESQSRRFTPGRLVSCMKAIHQTDLALKGAGGLPAETALERLVIGLAS